VFFKIYSLIKIEFFRDIFYNKLLSDYLINLQYSLPYSY